MKNVNLQTILLLVIALGIGYLIGAHNQLPQQEPMLIPEKTVSDSDLFAKKQECQKYTTEVEKKLESLNFSNPETGYQTWNNLEKIFYSPKMNSCLYIGEEWNMMNDKKDSEVWTLVDVLSGEMILSGHGEWNKPEYQTQRKDFENYMKEYE